MAYTVRGTTLAYTVWTETPSKTGSRRRAHDVGHRQSTDLHATVRTLSPFEQPCSFRQKRVVQAWESVVIGPVWHNCPELSDGVHSWYIPARLVQNGGFLPCRAGEVQYRTALTPINHVLRIVVHRGTPFDCSGGRLFTVPYSVHQWRTPCRVKHECTAD